MGKMFYFLQRSSPRQCPRRLSWEKVSISCKGLLPGNVHGDCLGRNSPFLARVFSPAMSTETVLGESFHFFQGSSPRQRSRTLSWEKFSISRKGLLPAVSTETVLGEILHFMQGSSPRQCPRRLSWRNSPFLARLFSPELLLRENFHFLRESSPRQCPQRPSREKISISCKDLLPGNVHGGCYWEKFSISCRVFSLAMSKEVLMGTFSISCKGLLLLSNVHGGCHGNIFRFLTKVFSSAVSMETCSRGRISHFLQRYHPSSVHNASERQIFTRTCSSAVSTEAVIGGLFQFYSPQTVFTEAVMGELLQFSQRRSPQPCQRRQVHGKIFKFLR